MTPSQTDALLARRALDFSLASTFASYPDDEVAATLTELQPALVTHPLGPLFGGDVSWDDLRSAYVERFDRGDARVSLYGTEYGRMRGMSKGSDLAELSGFYRAFGMTLDREAAHELQDHIAVELEFYAVLLQKQRYLDSAHDEEGSSIVGDARKKFLAEFLGPLAKGLAARLEGVTGAYPAVFAWCADLVGAECAELGVVPVPLDFFDDPEVKSEASCGSVHLPIVS